jgi:hypothetical protein
MSVSDSFTEMPSPRERQAIVEMCLRADLRDWSGLRSCLAEDLIVHFPAVFGGSTQEIPVDEFVRRWRQYLSRFESTQHLSTSHLVYVDGDGTRAICQSSF